MDIKYLVRWAAMPFAAVIGAFIGYLLVSLWIKGNIFGFEVYNGTEVGSISQIALAIAAQAVFGAAFVFCGTLVAPANQRVCAIVLSTTISVISAISFIMYVGMNGFSFMQMLHHIATIVGSILVARQFMEKDESIQYLQHKSNTFVNSDFSRLFNLLLKKDATELTEDQQKTLSEILVKEPKIWKEYCLSRREEFSPEFIPGSTFYAKNEDSDALVLGTVLFVKFVVRWWEYEVMFSEAVSVNNCWPDKKLTLSAKQIRDLSTQKATCSDCHYVF